MVLYLHFRYILNIIFFLLPISFLLGPAIREILILLIIFIVLFDLYKLKKFYVFQNNFFYLGLLFSLYIVILSLNSEFISLSLESSLFYFRLIIFSVCLAYLFFNYNNFLKIFLYSSSIVFIFIFLDSNIQYFFDSNLLGYSLNGSRVSSVFGDEKVLGGYIARYIPVLILLLILLNFSNYYILIILMMSFWLVLLSGERAALVMISVYLLLIIPIFFNIKKSIIFLFIFIFSFIALIMTDKFQDRFFAYTSKQLSADNYYYGPITFDDCRPVENGKVYECKLTKVKPTVQLFGNEFYIFSLEHTIYYKAAFKMFNDNKIFGIGPKLFREYCKKDKYKVEDNGSKNLACSTSPHNIFIQILTETGLIGFLFTLLVYLFFVYKYFKGIFLKKNIIKNNKYILFSYVNLIVIFFPFIPTGNFFNNGISHYYFLTFAFFLFGLYEKQKI